MLYWRRQEFFYLGPELRALSIGPIVTNELARITVTAGGPVRNITVDFGDELELFLGKECVIYFMAHLRGLHVFLFPHCTRKLSIRLLRVEFCKPNSRED